MQSRRQYRRQRNKVHQSSGRLQAQICQHRRCNYSFVRKAAPGGSVKKGDVVHAVVVHRQRSFAVPTAHMFVSTRMPPFSSERTKNPRGTPYLWLCACARDKDFMKILSLAPKSYRRAEDECRKTIWLLSCPQGQGKKAKVLAAFPQERQGYSGRR